MIERVVEERVREGNWQSGGVLLLFFGHFFIGESKRKEGGRNSSGESHRRSVNRRAGECIATKFCG